MIEFSKFFSYSFYRLIDRRCYVDISWNLSDGKSAKSCVKYLTKKYFGCLSNSWS